MRAREKTSEMKTEIKKEFFLKKIYNQGVNISGKKS